MASDLIFLNQNWRSQDEVLEKFGNKFVVAGYALDSFPDALKQREKIFPTGLQFSDFAIAIPHTDPEHVNKTAIGIATLEHPVEFTQMATFNQVVKAKLIIMLAIKEAHSQVEMLQKLIALLQDSNIVKEILSYAPGEEEKINQLLISHNIV
ncbi:PTS sugar transporter subunit IIA [Streptococcus halichoeri]|uniref:PTS sugar transporter subunit IIA n=1 Tax=Streptococcus halichoeri TaxID=254785 RepID=UPI0013593624|nr:PTS sugar transporter subunit IIA [Streptococcus halichoeri]